MSKRVLIISSNHTGHGHKSITQALCEQFSGYPDIETTVIDGFALGGNLGLRLGKLYGTMTRNAVDLYKMVWDISCKSPEYTTEFTEYMISARFLKTLKKIKPDIIISTHPSFNGSILNILEKRELHVPLMSIVADLVSISPLWADPRTDYTVCPSEEAKQKCIEFGVPAEKIFVTGFPIREKFCRQFTDGVKHPDYSASRPLECLIMSGGEGSGNMAAIAKILLNNYNSKLKILTGRNTAMKKRLEKSLGEVYPGRVEIFGFTEHVQELMSSTDIAFTRGSPNTMIEAVLCNVPLIITGSLPGQEEGNPEFAEKYGLGVVCRNVKKLKGLVDELLADDAKKLKEIRASQRNFAKPDAAKDIAKLVNSIQTADISYDEISLRRLKYNGLTKILPAITPSLKKASDLKILLSMAESKTRSVIRKRPVRLRKKK